MGFFSRFTSKAKPKAPSEPAIDSSTIEMLRELQEEDGPDLVAELFGVLFSDVPPRFQEIEDALAAGDAQKVAFVAHGLKSASGNLGCLPFSALCKSLEEAGRSGDLSQAPGYFESLKAEYQRIQSTYAQSYQQAA